MQLDDFAAAEPLYRRALEIAEQLGDIRGMTYVTGQLGLAAEAGGRFDEAEALYRATADGFTAEGDPVFAAYYLAFRGRALLGLDRIEEGVATLGQALALRDRMEPSVGGSLRIALGIGYARQARVDEAAAIASETDESGGAVAVELARGFAAIATGDRATAGERLAAAGARIGELEDLPLRRLAERSRDVLAGEVGSWRIRSDGSWVESPSGQRIEVGRHLANARILAWLLRQRTEAPGEATDVEGLALAGWPGERILPAAAANRVRVALSALRRAGIGELIERTEGGWRLDPAVEVRTL
jgi:hypothetical protein